MNVLINLLIYIIVFGIVAWGLIYLCERFQMPQPVKWICGGILLVIILIWVAGQVGDGGLTFPRLR